MRNRPSSVMLFAAGFGTRMKPLTDKQPKPLIQVGGKALIDHALNLVKEVSPETTLVNLHYLPEMIESHLAGTGVQTITESPDILETGGGLRNALPILGSEPVFTMNTDAVWKGPNPLQLALDAWGPDHMEALLICIPLSQTVGHKGSGDFDISMDGRLKRGGDLVYSGLQIIKTDRLAAIKERAFSLNVIWDQMAKDRGVFGLTYPGKWCDVGHPAGITMAENMLND